VRHPTFRNRLLVFVAIPALAFRTAFGYRFRDLFGSPAGPWRGQVAALVLLPLLLVLQQVFFRALLQERLAAATRSDAAAVFAASALFGLAQAPGLSTRPPTSCLSA
jgi:hypothetical protein